MRSAIYYQILQYKALAKKSRERILSYQSKHDGETVYILGTGPSLAQFDSSFVKGNSVILLNNSLLEAENYVLADAQYGFISDFLRISELRGKSTNLVDDTFVTTDKVMNSDVNPRIFGLPYVFIMPALSMVRKSNHVSISISDKKAVSMDLLQSVYMGKSVVFPAIQLAIYMGFKRIFLVGIDMSMNEKKYHSEQVVGYFSGFDYHEDGKEYFRFIHSLCVSKGISIIDLSSSGRIDELVKFKYTNTAEI